MNEVTLWEYRTPTSCAKLVAVPCDGPRGNRLRLLVTELGAPGEQPITLGVDLSEGPGRQLHLAARGWVRRQKELRGDTPRGQRKHLQRQLQYAEARAAAPIAAGGAK